MTLADLINSLGSTLKRQYGTPVFKLPVDAGFTCPNRDGSKARGGCSFCNNAAFTPGTDRQVSVTEQLQAGQAQIGQRARAPKYLAYFQAYTNTYADVHELARLYREALAVPDVIGLAVSTRPDCVPPEVIGLLAELQAEGQTIWLELGLQSAHTATLARLNRGHGFAEYQRVARQARAHGVPVCAHLIIGLPGEDANAVQTSLFRVLDTGVDGLKLHPLHVVKGTRLAQHWQRGDYQPWSLAAYAATAADLIEQTPAEIVYHRVSGTAPADYLLAPAWCSSRWDAINAIERELRRRGSAQGRQSTAAMAVAV